MTIKTEINESQFINALCNDQYAAWSRCAARALFDWYTELSECTGEEIDFDPIAIRCDWSEYHIQEIWDTYSNVFERHGMTESDDADDYDKQVSILQEYTTVIDMRRDKHVGGILLRDF
jgi:hypothetical protein